MTRLGGRYRHGTTTPYTTPSATPNARSQLQPNRTRILVLLMLRHHLVLGVVRRRGGTGVNNRRDLLGLMHRARRHCAASPASVLPLPTGGRFSVVVTVEVQHTPSAVGGALDRPAATARVVMVAVH